MLDIPDDTFDAYLFDCDGTLVDSMPLHYEGWLHAIREQGAKFILPEDMYYEQAGIETSKLVDLLNERFGGNLDTTTIASIKQDYVFHHAYTLRELTPVADFARHIHATHPVAVVTGGRKDMVRKSLKAASLNHLFELIVNFEDVEHGKPAPDMFLFAAEQLGVQPARCLVFEDGELGIQGAKAAGMKTVYVDRTVGR